MLDGNEANGVWVDENIYNSCQITPTSEVGWLLAGSHFPAYSSPRNWCHLLFSHFQGCFSQVQWIVKTSTILYNMKDRTNVSYLLQLLEELMADILS